MVAPELSWRWDASLPTPQLTSPSPPQVGWFPSTYVEEEGVQ